MISVRAREWGELRETHTDCVRVGSPAYMNMYMFIVEKMYKKE